jgi:hypothetical protein
MSNTVVTVVNNGVRFWLKGTTWAFSLDRADKFDSTEKAFAAIERAKKFNQKTLMKRVELWDETTAQKEAVQS